MFCMLWAHMLRTFQAWGRARPPLSTRQGPAPLHGRWPSPGLSWKRERRYCFAGEFASLKLRLSVFRMSFPPSRFVPLRFVLPAAALNAANITNGGVGAAARLPGAADPDSRVSCARAPVPAQARVGVGAVRAPDCAREAEDAPLLSAPKGLSRRSGKRSNLRMPLLSFCLHAITRLKYVKYMNRNISLLSNIWQSSSREPARAEAIRSDRPAAGLHVGIMTIAGYPV